MGSSSHCGRRAHSTYLFGSLGYVWCSCKQLLNQVYLLWSQGSYTVLPQRLQVKWQRRESPCETGTGRHPVDAKTFSVQLWEFTPCPPPPKKTKTQHSACVSPGTVVRHWLCSLWRTARGPAWFSAQEIGRVLGLLCLWRYQRTLFARETFCLRFCLFGFWFLFLFQYFPLFLFSGW